MNNAAVIAALEQQATEHEEAARAIRQAIAHLAPNKEAASAASATKRVPRGQDDGMTAHVRRILERATAPLSHSEIWRQLVADGAALNTTSVNPRNMIGSTLQQLRQKGLAIKTDVGWVMKRKADDPSDVLAMPTFMQDQ